MYKLYMSPVIPLLLTEYYFFLFIHLARVNWFGIRLPRLDSLQIGQCFVQENGKYHTRQVSVWLQKIKSNTCGNKFNVIYPLCKLSTLAFRYLHVKLTINSPNVFSIILCSVLSVSTCVL
jgi:hypothetical protein